MHSRPLFALIAFYALSALAAAGVTTGSRHTTLGGGVVSYTAVTHVTHNTTVGSVSVGDASSSDATCTPTNGGCDGETEESPDMSVHHADGTSSTFRVRGGKMQQKNAAGDFKNLAADKLQPTAAPGDEQDCGGSVSGGPGTLDVDTVGSHPDSGGEPGSDDEPLEGGATGSLPPLHLVEFALIKPAA